MTYNYSLRKIVEMTPEEYHDDMRKKLKEKGLREAVKEYCDKIDDAVSGTNYEVHRSVQEYLCDIQTLIELRGVE